MDIHVIGPTPPPRSATPSTAARPPDRGWDGGAARHRARRPHARVAARAAAKAQRHLLLPAFHAVQDRVGWVSRGAMNYICQRLVVPPAEAWGVLTFYHLFATEPRPRTVAHVCDDIACRVRGAEAICATLTTVLGAAGAAPARPRHDLDAQPVPGPVRAGAGGAGRARPGIRPHAWWSRRSASADAVARALTPDAARRICTESLAELRAGVPQAGEPGLTLLAPRGRRRSDEPRRLSRVGRLSRAGRARSRWARPASSPR